MTNKKTQQSKPSADPGTTTEKPGAAQPKQEQLIGPNEASQLLELLTRVPTTGFQEAQALIGLASRLERIRQGG